MKGIKQPGWYDLQRANCYLVGSEEKVGEYEHSDLKCWKKYEIRCHFMVLYTVEENLLRKHRISRGLINLRAWLQSTSRHRLRPVIYDLFASSFGALAPCFLNLTTGERYPCHKLKCIIVTAEHFKPNHSVVERRDRYRCWLFSGKNLL